MFKLQHSGNDLSVYLLNHYLCIYCYQSETIWDIKYHICDCKKMNGHKMKLRDLDLTLFKFYYYFFY